MLPINGQRKLLYWSTVPNYALGTVVSMYSNRDRLSLYAEIPITFGSVKCGWADHKFPSFDRVFSMVVLRNVRTTGLHLAEIPTPTMQRGHPPLNTPYPFH